MSSRTTVNQEEFEAYQLGYAAGKEARDAAKRQAQELYGYQFAIFKLAKEIIDGPENDVEAIHG